MTGSEQTLPDDTVVLTVTLGRFKELLTGLGVDVSELTEEDVTALRELAAENPLVDWNIFRAVRCAAEAFAELRYPPDYDDLLERMKATFDETEI